MRGSFTWPVLRDGEERLPKALSKRADRGRTDIVQVLRASQDLAAAIQDWRGGDLYRPTASKPVLMNLYRYPDGSVGGFAQASNGQIIGQAKWVKATAMGARVAASATMLVSHAMLFEISRNLDRIETKIDSIRQALDDDRRQALKGAISTVETALMVEDTSNARGLLYGAATPLRSAIEQEIVALLREINSIPQPPRKHIVGVVWDQSKKADKALAKCEGSVLAIFEGIRAICYLYLALDEPRSAWEVVADLMGRLSAVKLEAAKDKARMLRVSPGGSWPEQFWVQAIDAINMSCEQAIEFVATTKTSEENLPLTIELLPEEVAQIGAQPVPSVYSRATAKEAPTGAT